MQEEFVAGSTRGKLIFFGLILAAIVCLLLVVPLQEFLDTRAEKLADSDPQVALEYSLQHLLVVAVVSAIWMWGLSYFFFRFGLRIKKAGQFPPPGQCVPFRTKVQRGICAKVAYISILVFAGFLVIHPFVKFNAWYATSKLIKELVSPNHRLETDLRPADL